MQCLAIRRLAICNCIFPTTRQLSSQCHLHATIIGRLAICCIFPTTRQLSSQCHLHAASSYKASSNLQLHFPLPLRAGNFFGKLCIAGHGDRRRDRAGTMPQPHSNRRIRNFRLPSVCFTDPGARFYAISSIFFLFYSSTLFVTPTVSSKLIIVINVIIQEKIILLWQATWLYFDWIGSLIIFQAFWRRSLVQCIDQLKTAQDFCSS